MLTSPQQCYCYVPHIHLVPAAVTDTKMLYMQQYLWHRPIIINEKMLGIDLTQSCTILSIEIRECHYRCILWFCTEL